MVILHGAVDLTLSRLVSAVEGTVEVLISEVQSSFNLSLACVPSGLSKEICLFDGSIAESCGLKRSVVAVVRGSLIDLKFKLGSPSSSFRLEGTTMLIGIKTDFALISVKVTWSTLPATVE